MISREQCTRIGTLAKPHGVRGEILLRNVEHLADLMKFCSGFVFIDIDGGLVPFFLTGAEPTGNDETIISFDSVSTREMAAELKGKWLYIPVQDTSKEKVVASETKRNSYIGYTAIDEITGIIGIITAVDESEMNPLFIVDDGRVLIPAVTELVVKINQEKKQIVFSLPAGLLEL